MSTRPQLAEHEPYWSRYIDLVTEDDLFTALDANQNSTDRTLSSISEEKAAYRYAPGKWSIKEMLNHLIDAERVFAYRALAIARGDQQSLPGFDENPYAEASDADRRPFAEIYAEWKAVRAATLALFRSFSDEAWARIGTANSKRISVRALAYVTAGHERHHMKVLRERYLG
jgi:uncharacterized damage-inducible protein DinB